MLSCQAPGTSLALRGGKPCGTNRVRRPPGRRLACAPHQPPLPAHPPLSLLPQTGCQSPVLATHSTILPQGSCMYHFICRDRLEKYSACVQMARHDRGRDNREDKATFKAVVKHRLMSEALLVLYPCAHCNSPIPYPISGSFLPWFSPDKHDIFISVYFLSPPELEGKFREAGV